MRSLKVVLVAALAIALAGCVLSGKPKTPPPAPLPQPAPAAPPEPISIPQTDVDLPPEQPWNADALKTLPPVEPSAAPPVEMKPMGPAKPRTPPAVAKPVEVAPPPPPETATRPPIQEILSADEQKRLRDSTQDHWARTRALLEPVQKRHRLNDKEKRTVADINQFLKQSEQAVNSGDLRLADQLAERAHTLAKELQIGR